MRTRITLLLWVVILAGACSTTEVRLGSPIDCDTTKRGRLILFAQAVPTSEVVPCLGDLPVGWQISSIETRTGEAVIVFGNDTHDVKAVGTLTESCVTTGEGEPTGDPLITAYRSSADQIALSFTGGCFVVEFPEAVSDGEADALIAAVNYLSRDELRDLTGWTL